MDVGAPGPDGGDWLDVCCWRCGTAEAHQDSLGRMLCPTCRVEITDDGSTPPDDPLAVARGAYWHSHTLELCWRCLTESVDPEEEVGLCPACVTALAAETSGRQEPIGR
jgi:hypothetical protein